MTIPNSAFSIVPSFLSTKPTALPFRSTPLHAREPTAAPLISFSRSRSGAVFSMPSVGEDLPVNYGDWLPNLDSKDRRRAGVLLHPTSFSGPYGIGDLGDQAFEFLDWLHFSVLTWHCCRFFRSFLREGKPMKKDQPYSGQDANCVKTLLICLDELVKDGLLEKDELPQPIDSERVNFSAVADLKDPLYTKSYLKAAKRLIQSDVELKKQLEDFRKDQNIASWLEDAAYFAAIDDTLNTFNWYFWPEPLKNRHLAALEEIYQCKKDFIDVFVAQQFLFQRQWQKVRNYAQTKGISIMGDMPIYVGVVFPLLVSGVPPDAFSETGQLWDSPLYDWNSMEKDGFSWWIRRLKRAQDLYDGFRIDHFRGFAGFWAVPSESKVAMVGRWKVGPGKSLFDAILQSCWKYQHNSGRFVITEDVVQLRKSIGAPGMAVLQIGFGSDAENPHLPHNHECNQVVYTRTHDNDTVRILIP
ncbi:hypothetical protein Patl1_27557 [Pistacia atlantica]|uniref:Uncharacterized protein n=1 Tax=Pistacia atlantica TaxID=434234 RepID=A0ACC1BFP7_9ROSI|nr:hypothetical protein Patl1_27557 [Pistacia atlantica]